MESGAAESTNGAGQIVVLDVACPVCGYNVRGLPEHGRCPECSTPVAATVARHLGKLANPEWLAAVRSSGALVFLAGVWIFLSIAVGMLISGWSAPSAAADVAGMVALLGLLALLVAAIWRCTWPDPAVVARESWRSNRRFARLSTIALTALAVGVAGASRYLGPAAPGAVIVAIIGACTLLVWFLTRHVQDIAERLGDRLATDRARGYRRGFMRSAGALLASTALVATRIKYLSAVGEWVGLVSLVGVLSYGVLTLILPGYLADTIPRCLARMRRLGLKP